MEKQPLTENEDGSIGTLVETSMNEMLRFARAGHLETEPVFFKHPIGENMIIRGNHGFYMLVEHIEGSALLLFAHDYHLFDPVVESSQHDREGLMPGHWVNPANAGEIEVVAARDSRGAEKWVIAAVHEHDAQRTDDLERFGYLWHHNDGFYKSSCIIYHRDPFLGSDDTDKKKQKKIRKNGVDPDSPDDYETVRSYMTAGKDRPFFDFDKGFLRAKWGLMLTRSSIKKVFHKDKSADAIRDDFVKRASIIFRGKNPFRLGYFYSESDLISEISPAPTQLRGKLGAKSYIKATLAIGIQSLYMVSTHKAGMRGVATNIVKALAIGGIQLINRGILLGTIRALGALAGPAAKPFMRLLKADEQKTLFESNIDVKYDYGDKKYTKLKGTGYYPRLSQEHASLCRYLHIDETDAEPFMGAEIKENIRPDYAAHRLLDPFGAPMGSAFEIRKINNTNTLRVIQPDGIELYILIGKRTAFARFNPDFANDFGHNMHQLVNELMKETGNVLRVHVETDPVTQQENIKVDDINDTSFFQKLYEETLKSPEHDTSHTPRYDTKPLQEKWQALQAPKRSWRNQFNYWRANKYVGAARAIAAHIEQKPEKEISSLRKAWRTMVKNKADKIAFNIDDKHLRPFRIEDMEKDLLKQRLMRQKYPAQAPAPATQEGATLE